MTAPRHHLLVETHYLPDQRPACFGQARLLRNAGVPSTVLLVENGVTAAAPSEELSACLDSGADVLVDDLSLRQRGLGVRDLDKRVVIADMDWLAGFLLEGDVAVVWH